MNLNNVRLFLILLNEVRPIKLYIFVGIVFTLQVWKSCDEPLYAKRTKSYFSDRQNKPLFTVNEACNNQGRISSGRASRNMLSRTYARCTLFLLRPGLFFPTGFLLFDKVFNETILSASNIRLLMDIQGGVL